MIAVEMFSELASNGLHTLLSEKHLYQNHQIDPSSIFDWADEGRGDDESAEPPETESLARQIGRPVPKPEDEELLRVLRGSGSPPWVLDNPKRKMRHHVAEIPIDARIELRSLDLHCETCGRVQPFHPRHDDCFIVSGRIETEQDISLIFECQGCDVEMTSFLVRRRNLRLQLCGRAPIEFVPAPAVLPEPHVRYFRDGLVANSAGQTLAGLFLLRTFIEQFWKSVPEVANAIQAQRPTGEEYGEAYKETLPDDFKDRFPSLTEVYSDLSAALHDAQADAELFDAAKERIVKHFEARNLFEL